VNISVMGRTRSAYAATVAATAMTVGAMLLGCGGTDGPPLGGPYGGTAAVPSPSNEAGAVGTVRRCTTAASGGSSTPIVGGGSVADGGMAMGGGPAATWTQVFASYLTGCAAVGCHPEMHTAKAAYSWLKGKGQINGANSNLVSQAASCLKWYGGDMPPCGGSDDQAVSDMNGWAAAGALNN
jgi:hypothetical protein